MKTVLLYVNKFFITRDIGVYEVKDRLRNCGRVMNYSQVFSSNSLFFVKKWAKTYEFFTVSIRGRIFPIKEIDEMHSEEYIYSRARLKDYLIDKRISYFGMN